VTDSWPTELTYRRDERVLFVCFDDETAYELPAELLRVESPSAEVRGHGLDTKQTVPGKRDVSITSLEPVGNYAVRISFSDGHNTGLYSWAYLRQLGRTRDHIWRSYEAALAARGLSRDP
jgi:DUF971 family protein